MNAVAVILGALFAVLTARAEESTVALAEVEKLFQGKAPFDSVALVAESKHQESFVVGDMAARKNPAFPDQNGPLREGQIVMKEVPAHFVLAAQEKLEREWGYKAPEGISKNSITHAIQPYYFDWVRERRITKTRVEPKEALSAQDIYCLREGSAPLFQQANRPEIRKQLEGLGLKGLHVQFTVAAPEELAAPKLVREGNYLILHIGREQNSSKCHSASAQTIRTHLAKLYEPKLSETDRELLALKQMLEKSQAPLKEGSVIESRVEAKGALLADKSAPRAPASLASPADSAL